MKKYKNLSLQIVLFLVVGLVTFGIDFSVTTALFNIAGAPAYLASAAGFLSGFFFNFPMNRKKVFKHSKKDRFSLKTQVGMYFSLSVFNLLTTSLLVELLVRTELLTIGFAKVFVTGLIAVWNFLLFKFVVFSKQKEA